MGFDSLVDFDVFSIGSARSKSLWCDHDILSTSRVASCADLVSISSHPHSIRWVGTHNHLRANIPINIVHEDVVFVETTQWGTHSLPESKQ